MKKPLFVKQKGLSAKRDRGEGKTEGTSTARQVSEYYSLILEVCPEAIWEWEYGAPTSVWHGDKLARLLGSEENMGSAELWEKNVHPDDLKKIKELFEDTIRKGESFYTYDYQIKNRNGDYIYLRDRCKIIRNEEGQPLKIIGVSQDITIQKLYERALLEAKLSYQSLFDHSLTPKFIVDKASLRFVHVNQAAIAHYGYSLEEFLKMTILDIRPEQDRINLAEDLKTRVFEKSECFGVRTHLKKNREKISVEVSATSVLFQGKDVLLVTTNDITEKLKLQERVIKEKVLRQKKILLATVEAQEKEREKIGIELHDSLGQILATTRLYLDLAGENEISLRKLVDKSKINIDMVLQEIKVLSQSLAPYTLKDVGLVEAFEEVIEQQKDKGKFKAVFRHSGDMKGLDEKVQLSLFRILQEQLSNILKHADARGVLISLIRKRKSVVLDIKDNGKGFEVHPDQYKVGIHNIINRAEVYNGKASIKSAPGKGCHLKVEISLK